ncbi:hypothetical protein H8N03_11030 [Ramlibacter sp. USB13]|uniref:Uncharacterized protein n=1 Tax=Ramlibacter cellulosilyticus TaxID=2764187 RepID=A0A923SBS4_9BURK|nr:hypothetical protein [Ramlibacter cellulosilyticus]MBC5783478.1 hypothetical protein [Ramlibacter cellulosilyticus]
MNKTRLWSAAALLVMALLPGLAPAAGTLGPAALQARHAALGPELASNPFGGPLVLKSEQAARRIDGEVFAIVEHPFAKVSAALSDPAQWCEILILHLNTKYCRRQQEPAGTSLDVRIGKKGPQSVQSASKLAFSWRPPVVRPDYMAATLEAAEGPYDTRDYRLLAEAVPLDTNRTFLHMGYALSHGIASEVAMQLYLGTVAREKVGFTRLHPTRTADEAFVGGMRGVVERNTMRYYLAIDAYLDSLAAPAGQQLERRLQSWYDATEKYPRQLHEVERDAYLRMKREEVERQSAAR